MQPKLLFYVTNDQLSAFAWRRGLLTPGPVLRLDAAGLAGFGAYLSDHAQIPCYLIADLVEEDFQRVLLPHVRGRAGRNMVERRLAQLYRDTPMRHAALQERDEEGRRDDHALFSALTNPALVQPWLAVLEQHQAPLAGAYSGGWLSALLARRLALAQPHLLLITEQAGGLRQSYFQGPHLKFSRLTMLARRDDSADDTARATAQETERMQQFLTNTHLISRGEMLQVTLVAPAARMAALDAACEDGPETSFHFIDLDAAADLFKLEETPPNAERLLVELVAQQAPPSQYLLPTARRFYRIWQGRFALNALSAGVVVASALSLLASSWAAVEANRETRRLLADAARDDARYRAAMASFPASLEKATNMKAATQLEALLVQQAPAPAPMAALVSRALERAPSIRLTRLRWQAGSDTVEAGPGAEGAPEQLAGANDAARPIPAAVLGIPAAPAQVLRIEGEVEAPQSDYRTIVESLNGFAFDLARIPAMAVEIVEAPIDVRQNVRLTGQAGQEQIGVKPKFVLRATWKP